MKHDQKEQMFMIAYGEAGTGKSVFVDVLTHLLGHNNVSAVPLERWDDPHYVVETYGRMLNVTDESESKIEEVVESHIKHYTGGTVYQFKRMYEKPFTSYPTAKLMIVTNHLPAFRDVSNGIWRRILIVPFNFVVPEERRIKGLATKIVQNEMPGVLAWAVKGARKIESEGFIVPDICKKLLNDYRQESIPELAFFNENFEACAHDEQYGRVKCNLVRECYEKWCKAQGVGAKSNRKLLKSMLRLYPLMERKRGRDGTEASYYYYGFRMLPDSEFAKEAYFAEH
jgi:P4 family phage/plasmid primase-like protien